MDTQASMGLAHFVAQVDGLGKAILVVLFAMSVITWYVIVTKTMSASTERRRSERFLQSFRTATTISELAQVVQAHGESEPYSNVARHALAVTRHHKRHAPPAMCANTSTDHVMRAIRRVIDEESCRMQSGLTMLASVGSTAPFIGLLGTVWGVYHALVSIGLSGQGTLDKVAGPVGEALIMTALGLAVAIPAVLAYNFCVRRNRALLARLDAFAHDLFTFVTTGSQLDSDPAQLERDDRPLPYARLAHGAA